MMHMIAIITAALIVISGLYALAAGEWSKLGLKFAGVSLSTMAATWLLIADWISGGNVLACHIDNTPACLTLDLYYVVRNVAFLIFHIAVGRDAVHFKKRDRRGTSCQQTISKPLSRL